MTAKANSTSNVVRLFPAYVDVSLSFVKDF